MVMIRGLSGNSVRHWAITADATASARVAAWVLATGAALGSKRRSEPNGFSAANGSRASNEAHPVRPPATNARPCNGMRIGPSSVGEFGVYRTPGGWARRPRITGFRPPTSQRPARDAILMESCNIPPRTAQMDPHTSDLASRVPPAALLGYLNYSDGRPDAKFQRALDGAYSALVERGVIRPWEVLARWIAEQADVLRDSGTAAFRDVSQAKGVITLAFEPVLAAYRAHHRDLLAHQSDSTLFNSFFLARACEAVLAQGGSWSENDRIVRGAVHRLNDYVGHRPIAVLETRPQTELYPHERLRPVPLYIRGVGAASGSLRNVIDRAVRLLVGT